MVEVHAIDERQIMDHAIDPKIAVQEIDVCIEEVDEGRESAYDHTSFGAPGHVDVCFTS